MSKKYIQPILFTAVYAAALAYFGYKVLKDAWEHPPKDDEDGRKLIVDYDIDGNPIVVSSNEVDIDTTLEAWGEQNRLIKSRMK